MVLTYCVFVAIYSEKMGGIGDASQGVVGVGERFVAYNSIVESWHSHVKSANLSRLYLWLVCWREKSL